MFKKHLDLSRNNLDKIKEICEPLFSTTHFRYFGFTRFFRDGASYALYSNPEVVESVVSRGYGPPVADTKGIFFPSGIYFSQDLAQMAPSYLDKEQVEKFFKFFHEIINPKFDTGLNIVAKYEDFDDLFFFTSDLPIEKIRSYYLKQMPILNHFCWYFFE